MSDSTSNNAIRELANHLEALGRAIQVDTLRQELTLLEAELSKEHTWDAPDAAKGLSVKAGIIRNELAVFDSLMAQISDASVLLQLGESEASLDTVAEAQSSIAEIKEQLERFELQTYLSGEYDSRGAVVTIRSGAGGDDATDFAEMLMRMYLRYSEKQDLKARVLDVSYAEGAGIKSATFEVDSPFAFGNLSVESGTHRLVRMSPFNAAGKRQTSFAAVEVVPLVESTDAVEVSDAEIRVDVFRSSGPGGQSVNTTDSAVRITHIPTGIVVSCQNEKSQLQNKAAAMRVLQSRLLELKRQEEEAKKKSIAGDVKASWGEQMRSYVLAPYQMVKDLRTGHEENNPGDVFDGAIEGFISAGIRWRKQSAS